MTSTLAMPSPLPFIGLPTLLCRAAHSTTTLWYPAILGNFPASVAPSGRSVHGRSPAPGGSGQLGPAGADRAAPPSGRWHSRPAFAVAGDWQSAPTATGSG